MEVCYQQGKLMLATIDFDAADLRCLLLGGASAPSGHGATNPDLDHVSDLLALTSVAELTATNYVRKTLAGVTAVIDDTNDRVMVSCNPLVWTALGLADGSEGPARALVIYLQGASDAARLLLAFYDTGFPKGLNGEDLTVSDPDGFLRIA